jgi:hypothetical protein
VFAKIVSNARFLRLAEREREIPRLVAWTKATCGICVPNAVSLF